MKGILGFVLMLAVALPAMAGFQGYNGTTDLKIFDKIKCSTGVTCTRTGKGLFTIVSSPTISTGTLSIAGAEATNAILNMQADESDDNGDDWRLQSVASGNAFTLSNDVSGSMITKLSLSTAGALNILGSEAADGVLTVSADESDDNGDDWTFTVAASGNALSIGNDVSGSVVSKMTISTTAGNVSGPGTGTLSGFLAPQVAATATTITAAQCGSTFSNSGAVQMELPEASTVIGCRLTFVTLNASNFDVNPDTGDQILTVTNAAGDAMRNATVGNSIVIQAVSASQWAEVAVNGTWSDIN